MLRELFISNFILIEETRVEFDAALNVLTGETGAGKSIILDAVTILLGERFSSEQIRPGASKSEIVGTFDRPDVRRYKTWMEEKGLELGDELILRREASLDGKSKAFLNDRPITLQTLSELREFLVEIHGQHAFQRLLKTSEQRDVLDGYGQLEERADKVREGFHAWDALEKEKSGGFLSETERLQKLEMLKFQVDEIEAAKLKPDEEETLSQHLPELKNSDKLRSYASAAYQILYGEDESVVSKLGQVAKAFEALVQLAPVVTPVQEEVSNARQKLEEASRTLKELVERWESDPAALEAVLARQDLIERFKKKYGKTVPDILQFAETQRQEMERLNQMDEYKKQLEARIAQTKEELEKRSVELSKKRQQAAKQLTQAVQQELKDLGLGKAVFECRVEPIQDPAGFRLSANGIDSIEFFWSPNPGEGTKPLKEIASGGEMSRVMLALKTVLAKADQVPCVIFDEIDAGIGGLTAVAVGRKLRALAKDRQILCVSHLAQIASSAQAHFQVNKVIINNRTIATMQRVEGDPRLEEIARMLGSDVTPTSLQHAKELLTQNQ